MTVFMGTRQAYQFARFRLHSRFALFSLCLLIGVPISVCLWNTEHRGAPLSAGGVLVLALSSRKGRKNCSRLINETFYGSLFSVTGVFHTKGANRVGN